MLTEPVCPAWHGFGPSPWSRLFHKLYSKCCSSSDPGGIREGPLQLPAKEATAQRDYQLLTSAAISVDSPCFWGCKVPVSLSQRVWHGAFPPHKSQVQGFSHSPFLVAVASFHQHVHDLIFWSAASVSPNITPLHHNSVFQMTSSALDCRRSWTCSDSGSHIPSSHGFDCSLCLPPSH